MRKVVLGMHSTLDGFVAAPAGKLDWVMGADSDEIHRWIIDSLSEMDTILLGRVAYQQMAAYWPFSTEDLAAPMNNLVKVVFSKTLDRAEWNNSRVVRGDLAEEISHLKQQPGEDMVVQGGSGFAQAVVRLGLVDEYRLVTHPVAFGDGASLFKDLPAPINLQLLNIRTSETGAVLHVYRPV